MSPDIATISQGEGGQNNPDEDYYIKLSKLSISQEHTENNN